MITYLVNFYSKRFLSRWSVLFLDIIFTIISFIIAYIIRYNFNLHLIDSAELFLQLLKITAVYLIFFLLIGSYSGILRHTGLSDVMRIIKSAGLSFLFLMGGNFIIQFSGESNIFLVPVSVIILHFLLTLAFLVGIRVTVKLLFIQITRQFVKEKIPVIIYGAGDAGMLTKNALIKDVVYRYEIVAYVDDNESKVKKLLEGIPIISPKTAFQLSYITQNNIQQLIIAIQNIHPEKKKKIIEFGLNFNLKIKVVPAINLWINGQLSSQQLRNVKIEELLERDVIKLDNKNIKRELESKVIMVTGGAGSIGSEIARQVFNYKPKRLIIVDQSETPIFDLQNEFYNNKTFQNNLHSVEFIIANVKDKYKMDKVFDLYRPDIVYHAAAYKHVPLMEQDPYEALMINVFGTKNIADLSIKYEVEKFVMISTDKAVNPTNIMGASKRIAEMCIQSLQGNKTKFITTRFGNVLGSNGSVVPYFKKQIESGGPITITHKEITRYFMTIPEACNLVLEAGAMGNGSEIFIFDMGNPVKIYDLAKKMIVLYGLSDKEIEIKEIGLRPGEKLYEELLCNKENILPTHHPKIMKAKVSTPSNGFVCNYIETLSEIIINDDEFALVAKMKEIIPEFISNNSVFEKLDKKVIN